MNIKGLDRAVVLKALYDRARVLGMGALHAVAGDMPIEEARNLVAHQAYFDYVHGRVMKINLSKDEVETFLYNRDNGQEAAELVVDVLRHSSVE
jgi:hypothetical protein